MSLNYKVLFATVIMIVILRIQQRLKPYIEISNNTLNFTDPIEHQNFDQKVSNNHLEYYEIMTGSFIIYSTIIFEDHENNQSVIQLIAFIAGK